MESCTWEVVQDEFANDGCLRDICILSTSLVDWRLALNAIRNADYQLNFFHHGESRPFPNDVEWLLSEGVRAACLLTIQIGGIQANCHFFEVVEIEFDVDPKQINNQRTLDDVISFMRCLAAATEKPVILTPENGHEIVVLKVAPNVEEIEYSPYGPWQ